jgi:hypothetical protein
MYFLLNLDEVIKDVAHNMNTNTTVMFVVNNNEYLVTSDHYRISLFHIKDGTKVLIMCINTHNSKAEIDFSYIYDGLVASKLMAEIFK